MPPPNVGSQAPQAGHRLTGGDSLDAERRAIYERRSRETTIPEQTLISASRIGTTLGDWDRQMQIRREQGDAMREAAGADVSAARFAMGGALSDAQRQGLAAQAQGGLAARGALLGGAQAGLAAGTQGAGMQAQESAAAEQGRLGAYLTAGQMAGAQADLAMRERQARLAGLVAGEAQSVEERRQNLAMAQQIAGGASAAGGAFAAGASQLSDIRLKQDVAPMAGGGMDQAPGPGDEDDLLRALRGYTYEYNPEAQAMGAGEGPQYGIMAQDVEQTRLGQQMVDDTPQGKMLPLAKTGTTALALLGRVGERLEGLEQALSSTPAPFEQMSVEQREAAMAPEIPNWRARRDARESALAAGRQWPPPPTFYPGGMAPE